MPRASRARRRFLATASLFALMLFAAAPAAAPGAATRFVYVTNGGFAGSNNVSALRINADGSLTSVAGSPFTPAPAQTVTEGLSMTPDGRSVYAAHFGTNGVSGWNVQANGALTPALGSPFATGAGTGPLGSSPSPDGSRLYVLNHVPFTIGVWNIAANGSISQIAGSPFPAKSGAPFPVIMAPDGKTIYIPNENGADGNTVTAYSIGASGAPTEIQTIATGANPFGGGITPNGRFVYVSNPNDNANVGTVSGFSVGADAKLTPVPGTKFDVSPLGGSHPLNVAIAPDGEFLYVATRQSNSVFVFRINANGSLSAIQNAATTAGSNGKGVALTPDGKRLYVSNNLAPGRVSGFNVAANGTLTLIPGQPAGGYLTGGNEPDLETIVVTPNQPPTAVFTAQAATAGQASSFDAAGSSDSDGGTVAAYQWSFGDGSTLIGGPTTAHVYTEPGTYIASLTLTDDEGCSVNRIFTGKATLCNGSGVATTSRTITVPAVAPSTPPSTPPTPRDATAPRFLSALVVPSTFAVDARGAAEALVSAVEKGTTLRYSLSEPARVVFTVDRKTSGRLVGSTCKKKTSGNRRGKKCTRLIREGRFAKLTPAGTSIKRFSGRMGGKTLRISSYQLTFDATDVVGNRAQPQVRNFKIVTR